MDTRDVNDLGPAKFKTQAETIKSIFAIITERKEIELLILSCFLGSEKKKKATSEIICSIVYFIDKTKRNGNIYFEISNELSDFNNGNVQYKQLIQRVSEGDIVGQTSTDRKQRQYTTRNDQLVSKKPRFLSR